MNVRARLLSALLALLPAASAFAQTPELFLHTTGGVDPQAASSASIVRGVPVAIDLALLYRSYVGDIVRFSSFNNESFDLLLREREEIAAVPGAFHWHADVVGQPQGLCTITVVGTSVTAYLVPGDLRVSTLAIQPAPGMHCLRELRTVERCACQHPGGLPHVQTEPDEHRRATPLDGACDDDTRFVQVLCVYDNYARDAAGGDSQIQSILLNGIAQTSTVMSNSGIFTTMTATSVRHVAYSANDNMSTTLSRLATANDGYMDEVHAWRTQEMADLVTLAVGDRIAFGTTGGIAYAPGSLLQLESAANGFSVCRYNLITDYVLAHELGHNFGCEHDNNHATSTPYQPYAYGYTYRFRTLPIEWLMTVMSYEPTCLCQLTKARVYSTPSVTAQTSVGGLACGDATHNNARLIRETRQYIANWGLRVTSLYEPPTIVSQPQNRNVCPGPQTNPIMMSVIATNAGSYQWLRWDRNTNVWAAIPGQTGPDLTMPVVSSTDLDLPYTCLVNGRCSGAALARSAYLRSAACGATFLLGNSAPRLGLPLATLGDYDGDGYNDFAVSDPEYGANNGGAVWIVSGQTLAVLHSVQGSFALERFGQDMAGLDGKLIVSGPDKDSGLGAEGEILEIFHNSSGGLSQRLLLRGRTLGLTHIGSRLAVTNYLNGDGARDLVFTADNPAGGTNNLVVACSANAGSTYREHWRYVAPVGIGALEIVGDMDGDGFDDVALGMPTYNSNMGRLEILSGRDGSRLNARNGIAGSQFGFAVQGMGDLDGDGAHEIVVSAPAQGGGYIYAMSLDLQTRWSRSRSTAGDRFGYALSSTGDGDGDGVQDVLVSRFPSTSAAGGIELISGATRAIIRYVTGTTNDYGRAVLSADLSGDGQVDDIVMEPRIGTVYVYASAPTNGPASLSAFGSICAGSLGNLPRSSVAAPPLIGGSVVWRLGSAPASTLGVLQLGVGSIYVPLDGLGAAGCSLQVNSFISASVQTNANGLASLSLSIPNDPLYIGFSMLSQWLVLDVGANSLNVTTSNASSFVIGG